MHVRVAAAELVAPPVPGARSRRVRTPVDHADRADERVTGTVVTPARVASSAEPSVQASSTTT